MKIYEKSAEVYDIDLSFDKTKRIYNYIKNIKIRGGFKVRQTRQAT